ncbi:MAG: O-sialoglycoprotein endopeptidase [Parcubacteria group bacterium Gr01-1014_13]|nr:MAG: O-sialoglycoprotein endopeptidase [Parcubacteria group bacterium Gr01-1014_13]
MYILGIESSCDDTSVALLDSSDKGHFVLFEKTASQIEIHKKYGGVVPEIAGRMHAEKIVPLIDAALEGQPKPDAIAVTAGPGLITGLLVGVEAARTLSYALDIPLIRTNHIEGHIYSVELQEKKSPIQFPALCLVVSGGHTELILMTGHGKYKFLGATKDDAAGECFDKTAKLLGLPYPGGPQISKLAETGNIKAIKFPRPMMDDENYLFSFAGLKTSALYWLRDNKLDDKITTNDFCASFEQAIVDVLVFKTLKAAAQYKPKTIILAGGVSANKKLRQTLDEAVKNEFPGTKFMIPQMKYAMDNGAMIATAGYYHAIKKDFTSWKKIQADPNWELAR